MMAAEKAVMMAGSKVGMLVAMMVV